MLILCWLSLLTEIAVDHLKVNEKGNIFFVPLGGVAEGRTHGA